MNDIATTIFNQIGGNKSMYMIGGNNLSYTENSFMFRFKLCKKFNHCTITLNSNNTYDVRFIKIWGNKLNNDTTYRAIYCDRLIDLFQMKTGLTLTMPQVVGFNC